MKKKKTYISRTNNKQTKFLPPWMPTIYFQQSCIHRHTHTQPPFPKPKPQPICEHAPTFTHIHPHSPTLIQHP